MGVAAIVEQPDLARLLLTQRATHNPNDVTVSVHTLRQPRILADRLVPAAPAHTRPRLCHVHDRTVSGLRVRDHDAVLLVVEQSQQACEHSVLRARQWLWSRTRRIGTLGRLHLALAKGGIAALHQRCGAAVRLVVRRRAGGCKRAEHVHTASEPR